MNNSGLLLSTAAFGDLTPSAQQEVLSVMGLVGVGPSSAAAQAIKAAPRTIDEGGPAELTLAFVRRLTDKLSEKTLIALKVIAQSDTPQFHMKDIIDATSGAVGYMDMRGVWSALTRRTRSILNDSNADLIWWDGEGIHDASGNYVDHVGKVAPLTHESLKVHFGL
jgi:hypothetical protein